MESLKFLKQCITATTESNILSARHIFIITRLVISVMHVTHVHLYMYIIFVLIQVKFCIIKFVIIISHNDHGFFN